MQASVISQEARSQVKGTTAISWCENNFDILCAGTVTNMHRYKLGAKLSRCARGNRWPGRDDRFLKGGRVLAGHYGLIAVQLNHQVLIVAAATGDIQHGTRRRFMSCAVPAEGQCTTC